MDFTYYIYALDIKKRLITAALLCPDEATADRIYEIVDQRMEEEHGVGWSDFIFDFGIAVTEDCDDSHNEIEYKAQPRYEREGWTRKLLCKYNDFALAAMQTEKSFRTSKISRLDLQYMFFAKLALEGKPLQIVEEMTPKKRDAKSRAKRIREAACEYYTRRLKGEDVTKESIAVKHGFKKERNVLSKESVQSKYGLAAIEQKVDDLRAFENITNIDEKERAKLLTLIYKIFR